MNLLTFLPFEPIVDPSFWHKFTQIKLDIDRLSESPREIVGYTLDSVGLTNFVDYSSLESSEKSIGKIGSSETTTLTNLCGTGSNHRTPLGVIAGHLINFNSVDTFKSADKNLLLEKYGAEIKNAIYSEAAVDNPTLLNHFILITFADLKNYNFIFWFGFPALANFTFPIVGSIKLLSEAISDSKVQSLLQSHSHLEWPNKEMFCAVDDGVKLKCQTLRYFIDNFSNDSTDLYLCVVDGSVESGVPGWPSRNLLSLIAYFRKTSCTVKLIVLRLGINYKSSFIVDVDFQDTGKEISFVGWTKNARGKFGPRSVNLSNSIDPLKLADSSVDLNLKLMKWRLVPQLDLEIVKNLKVLLIGAGTLGSSVARCLMGWGVRNITFIDNGNVSFSNPVRQSLYNYEDCDLGNGPKKKAEAAPAALKRILPSMTSRGVNLTVPMPGHPTEGLEEASQVHDLIAQHDVVFLLTDSRESRWLPTLIAASLNKLVITAALGYDTYLVMRHGIKKEEGVKLGCYFCNDVTAPGNSKADRTLDQQCTVTRPGVSNMASAIAVELLISILQHPSNGACNADDDSILGLIPHSVRGFLFEYKHVLPSTPAFEQCIACSPKVVDEYLNNRNEFLNKVFKSATHLEDLTGLTQLHEASNIIDILELSDDSGEEGD